MTPVHILPMDAPLIVRLRLAVQIGAVPKGQG